MIGYELTGDFEKAIRGITEWAERAPMLVGEVVAEQIVHYSRDLSMTPDGATFAAYVPRYAEKRKKAGLQTARVDLTWTKQYLDSIKPVREGADVYVGPAMQYGPRAEGLSKKRPHIGVAVETPALAEKKLHEEWSKL